MRTKTHRILVVWLFLAATAWAQEPGVPNDFASGVQQLEDRLENTPGDKMARLVLVYLYFSNPASLDTAKVIQARRKHILWLVQNTPEEPVAGGAAATIDRSGHPLADPEGYRLVSDAWRARISGADTSVVVLRNAASFFKVAEKELAAGLLERALTIEPANQEVSSLLGMEYGLAILGVTLMDKEGVALAADPAEARAAFAGKALQSLQRSTNVDVLASAFVQLLFQSNRLRSMGQLEFDADTIAEAILPRVVTLVTLDPANQRTIDMLGQVYRMRAATTSDLRAKAALWRQASRQFEAAAKGSQSPDQRFSILMEQARAHMEAGDMEYAEAAAIELLAMAEPRQTHRDYGNALHRGNLILGTIALKAGDTPKAKAYLLAAGRTPGSEQLNALGPNMALARDLLLKGERATVVEYLVLCRAFWETDAGALQGWIAAIEAGGTPDFGENLTY